MEGRHTQLIGSVLVLAIAVAIGVLAMTALQRKVPVLPGVQGCERLQGVERQTSCIARHYQDRADKRVRDGAERGSATAWAVAQADLDAATDAALGGSCHPAMHLVGRREGTRVGRSNLRPVWPDQAERLCTAGYVHGLAEGYFAQAANPDLAELYPSLCAVEKASSGCAHGLGHAVIRKQPARDVDDARSALRRCDTLPGERAFDCANGVYMEIAMQRDPRVSVPSYGKLCTAAATASWASNCAIYLPLSASTNERAQSTVPKLCEQYAVGAARTLCFSQYGRDIGTDGLRSCERVAGTRNARSCVNGALVLRLNSGHITPGAARSACNDLAPLRSYCLDRVQAVTSAAGEQQTTRSARHA